MIETIVKDRIYSIKVPLDKSYNVDYVNIYFLLKEKIIIDIGPNYASVVGIENLLAKFNLKIFQLEGIILTHSHLDHCGALPFIPKSIPIYYNNKLQQSFEVPLINKISSEKKVLIEDQIKNNLVWNTTVNKQVKHYTELRISNLQILCLAGHSDSDLCIRVIDLNAVFCGDLLVKKSLIDSHYLNQVKLKRCYFKSLMTLYRINSNIYLSSHDEILTQKEVKCIFLKKIEKNKKALLRFSKELECSKDVTKAIDKAYPLIGRISNYFEYSEFVLMFELLCEMDAFENLSQFHLKNTYQKIISNYFIEIEKEFYE